jgi:hypothetical protein
MGAKDVKKKSDKLASNDPREMLRLEIMAKVDELDRNMQGQKLFFAEIQRAKADRDAAGLKNCDTNFINRNVQIAGEPDLLAER